MLRNFYTSLFVLALLASCSPQNLKTQPAGAITLADCALTSPSGDQVDAECGTLKVPEDRSNPTGRKINLSIAVIRAIKRDPDPDALFLLAGGPGQATIETFPAMIPLLYPIHEDRDIVLVDQRGTGKSNPLRCLDPEEESLDDEAVLAKLKACPATLDADLRFYTTEIAMTDLDQVRSALGYETINIYGGSYGTRAALTYLRMFPKHVRSLTLDAVVDPGFVMFMDAAEDGQAALDKFFARCDADEDCQKTFPELRSEFEGILTRLQDQPADITIPHPITNKPLDLTVTRAMITNMVFNALYVPDLVATLPLSIHAAYAEDNYVPLISQAFLVNAGLYDGMFYAVACTEDAPLLSSDEAASRSEKSIFGDRTVDFKAVCAEWPRGKVSSEFRQPIISNVPVLIFSGEADPITPPWHADQVAESLTNELQLVFAGMGHGNLGSRCTTNIFRKFIETGMTEGLDTSCVEAIQPPPFFLDFSGPRP